MPLFFVFFGKAIAFAFQRVHMNDDRVTDIFHFAENFDQGGDIVSVFLVNIIEPPGFEEVVFRFAVRFAQKFQVFVNASVRFGNGLLIVVTNLKIMVQFGYQGLIIIFFL